MAVRLPADGEETRLRHQGNGLARPIDDVERFGSILFLVSLFLGIFFIGRAAAAYFKHEGGFAGSSSSCTKA
ncbi:hypothetical protein N7456_004917 [Penicillium angulare]|uniref:Uncharacterized protein n=1 Tax=Penicillium angulare TaxID=116970 RepID=A0A9W9KK31_9EURO|nr:hypothetical protein N7456_004917 [Penicillium angulare]